MLFKNKALQLRSLILTNFKNYENQRLDFCEKVNGLVGQNGAGKTNLLDAIYYLCMCKSYFSMPDSAIARHEQDFFRAEGHFHKQDEQYKVVSKVRLRRKKELECNDVVYAKLSEHIGLLPVVIIAPDDTRLATEGSEYRRKFIDETLSQLDSQYLKHLIHYNKVLTQRNAALKQMAANGRFDEALISVYDTQLLPDAAYIHTKRQVFLNDFLPIFINLYAQIAQDREAVNCHYKSALNDCTMQQLLDNNRQKDQILQRTTGGIHRDDLVFSINEKPVKRFASQGQLKSFILSMKLAQFELFRQQKNETPILLLDDIFDKLDESRVEQLMTLLLGDNFEQVFITDAHEQRLTDLLVKTGVEHKMFRVSDGAVETV